MKKMKKKTITPEEAVAHLEEFKKEAQAHIWKVYNAGVAQLSKKIEKLKVEFTKKEPKP